MRWSGWAMAGLLGLAGCGESVPKVPAAMDDTAPETVLQVVLAGGRAIEASLEAPFVTRSDLVEVRIVADEPASIVYAIGAPPDLSDPFASRGGRTVALSFVDDTDLYWVATDAAGNQGAEQRFQIRFDHEPPTVELTPYGGEFDGPVEISIEADEPATVRYTLDGRWPITGDPSVIEAEAPVRFTADASFELNALVTDAAGNQVELAAVQFDIDTEAPQTQADPPGGFYLAPQQVRLVTNDPDAVIRYTLDGSEPGPLAPVYEAPIQVDQSLALRFRAQDVGGNLEAVREAAYQIGDRTAPPAARLEPVAFDTAGGLGLAAELLSWAGARSGREGSATLGLDDAAWAAGREGVDAFIFRAGVGPHGLHAPLTVARAMDGGAPDDDGDGSNRDDTWAARAQAVTALVDGVVPVDAHPPYLAYVGSDAVLLTSVAAAWTDDGRPQWVEDLRRHRWSGARVEDRRVTAASSAGLVEALTARGLAGTAGSRIGGPNWGGVPADTVGLRCAGCHRPGAAEPPLHTPQALLSEGLVVAGDGDASPLLSWLAGDGAHPTAPAPEVRIARVRAWIDAGAPAIAAAPAVGSESQGAALAVMALDHLPVVIDALADLMMDAQTGEPSGDGVAAYVPARLGVLETAAGPGLPRRVETIQVEDRALDVAGNARLLAALADAARVPEARPTLYRSGPLADGAVSDRALGRAQQISRALVDGAQQSGGGFASLWRVSAVPDARVDAAATAAAATGLALAGRVEVPGASAAAARAGQALLGLVDARGDVAPGRTQDGLEAGSRELTDQLAALGAFSVLAEDGVAGAPEARDALWRRLEAAWWDDVAGVWQTTGGQASYLYSADRVAAAARALRRCRRSGGCAEGPARLARLVQRVALDRLLLADTWLSGEVAPPDVPDGDGDGLPRPEAAMAAGQTGLAPVFAGAWQL